MKKKVLIITIISLLVLVLGISSFIFINSNKVKVSLKDDLIVNLNAEAYNTDYLIDIKNGTLIGKKKAINTTKLGKVEVTLKIKDNFKRVKNYSYLLEVVDREAPKIKFNDKLTVIVGNEINLLKDVVVSDNSKENIKVTVEGKYDLNTPNTYNLEYVAKDSSGNETREVFTLEVISKEDSNVSLKTTTSTGHDLVVRDGVTYIDGVLIANKTYSLPSSYNPGGITSETSNAFKMMQSAASSQGISIWIASGLRTYNTQVTLYNNYVARDGKVAADTYSARPGHSEHQTGLAFDLNKIDDNFGKEAEGIWLAKNCWKYGFILRYPEGRTNETGYVYEPWHFRYVGVDLATKLYNGGNWITLESYFGITSQYSY